MMPGQRMDDHSQSHPSDPAFLKLHSSGSEVPEISENRSEDQASQSIDIKMGRVHVQGSEYSGGESVISLPPHNDRAKLGASRARRLDPACEKMGDNRERTTHGSPPPKDPHH